MPLSEHDRAPGVMGEKASHRPACYVRRRGGKVARLWHNRVPRAYAAKVGRGNTT